MLLHCEGRVKFTVMKPVTVNTNITREKQASLLHSKFYPSIESQGGKYKSFFVVKCWGLTCRINLAQASHKLKNRNRLH